jgi:hypothetical protein
MRRLKNRADRCRSWVAWVRRAAFAIVVMFVASLAISYGIRTAEGALHWNEARRDSSWQAPDPKVEFDPVVQVYAGRAWGWRGAFGVHTWIVTKRRGAEYYLRHEVIGWGVRHGSDAVRVARGVPDAFWFGSKPKILADFRGAEVEALIDQIEAAGKRYPYNDRYTVWPGPNSNTFTAFVAREVPALRVDLPPTAVGKDYLVGWNSVARSPSGTGFQLSLGGLVGVMLALEEGLEVNLLGLIFGLDINPPALKLPGIGRIGP